MKRHITKYNCWLLLLLIQPHLGCKKYLDAKPNVSLEIPTTISDLQALLDNSGNINNADSYMPEAASDDYYVPYSAYTALGTDDQMNYIWDANTPDNDTWSLVYANVYIFNNVLDNINSVSPGDTSGQRDIVRGSALFYRAFAFYNLAEVYAKPYNASTAGTDLGICLRMTSSVTAPSTRATVKQTYDQIIGDLKTSIGLLPVTVVHPTRPDKAAAYAMLARVYLAMADYSDANTYADSSLALQSALMDYNTIRAIFSHPFPFFNQEVIFHSVGGGASLLSSLSSVIDTNLYASYPTSDLRKSIFFKSSGLVPGGYYFKGSYSASTTPYPFDGLAVDEMYLIKAECEARNNDITDAMADLNTLLVTRWKTGTYVPYSTSTADSAVNIILAERRKELVWRGSRWTDLRRLNMEPSRAITISRVLNGVTYALPPNDNRYTFLIPQKVISLANIPQNPR